MTIKIWFLGERGIATSYKNTFSKREHQKRVENSSDMKLVIDL